MNIAATTTTSGVIDEANALRKQGEKLHRHSDALLYAILAGCLKLCERSDEHDFEVLRVEYGRAERAATGKRFYIEKNSDPQQIVCRYVFRQDENRANVNRYALALREAAKLQIRSDDLVEWLKTNGGINALFLRRPVEAELVSTKCLRLDRQITISKNGTLTITLERRDDNVFRVIEVRA